MIPMNGLAGLLSSDTTREVNLSCGISLVFSKYTFGKYTDREDEIVRLRGTAIQKSKEVAEAAKDLKNENVKKALYSGLEKAVGELVSRPKYAYMEEDMEFENSNYGRIYQVWLLCHEKSELKTLEDYTLLCNGFSIEDIALVNDAINWAKEVDYLKNSDSPMAEPVNSETSPIGDNS